MEANGSSAWARRVPTGALAVDPEGNVIVAAKEGLLSYRAADGEPRWTFPTKSPPGPPAIAADGTAYAVTQTGLVHAVDSKGRARWSFALEGPALSSPTVGADGTLYLTTSSGPSATLYALDEQGAKRFVRPLPSGAGRPAVAPDGRLYCVGSDRRLHALAMP
jgi:outer membrane protein assembly factor BamB